MRVYLGLGLDFLIWIHYFCPVDSALRIEFAGVVRKRYDWLCYAYCKMFNHYYPIKPLNGDNRGKEALHDKGKGGY